MNIILYMIFFFNIWALASLPDVIFQWFSNLEGIYLFDPEKIHFIQTIYVQGINISVVDGP